MSEFLSFIGLIATAIIGAVSTWMLWEKRHSDGKANQEAEIELKRSATWQNLLNEVQEERTNLAANNKILESKIKEYESERKIIIQKLDEAQHQIVVLEKNFEDERKEWKVREKSMMATINSQNDKIAELEKKVNGVKHDTDKLKKKTGELNEEIARKSDEERRTRKG